MSDFTPTAAQKEAIETRGGAVLVSAGAGSGKTKVLTERLMRFILDRDHPHDITEFVVITFTKAAAAELKGRITEELSRAEAALEEDESVPAAFLDHVRRQSALCGKAQIGTIHHFCSSVLKEFGAQAGIAPDFTIINDDLALSLKEETLNRVLDAEYRKIQNNPGFEELVNSVGTGRNDDRLANLVLSLYEKMQCHARPDLWAQKCVAALNQDYPDVGETPWGKEILRSARFTAAYWAEELDRIMEAVSADETVSKAYLPGLAQGAEGVRELERRLRIGWEAARGCPPVAFGRFSSVKKDHAPELTEMVKKRRDSCKRAMEKISGLFYADSKTISEEMKKTAPPMEALLQLTLAFEAQYSAEKSRNNQLDYADLEHYAARLLTKEDHSPTDLAVSLSKRFTEIMIDEYQDVSRVQEDVFQAISDSGSKLFMVGDVKQAIYRFRLADPDIFNEKYKTYPLKSLAGSNKPGKIILRENFRSRKEILLAANSIFSCCMTEELGDVAYDEDSSLVFGAKGYRGEVPNPEVSLLSMPAEDGNEYIPDKVTYEARYTAEKILRLVKDGTAVTGSEGERKIRFGDIAILLRNANSIGGIYRKALTERGIPVANGQGIGFFETREVSYILSMLQVMDNPGNEVALLALLTSPLAGFTGDELAAIRMAEKDAGFYDALKTYAETDEKARQFLVNLNTLRDSAPDLTAEKLVREILYRTDLLAICNAMPDREKRHANLLQMLSFAARFEKEGNSGLHRFVCFLEKLKKKDSVPSAQGGEESAVHIMSIHHSKGLEFPVVFLCDTARRFNLQDAADSVLVHPELGLGPKITDSTLLVQYPTLARKAIALRLKKETLSEEMRLLYVAVTRAKERLFISAVLDDAESFLEKQRGIVPLPGEHAEPEALSGALTPIEWIAVAALADGGKHLSFSFEQQSPAFEEKNEEEQYATPDEDLVQILNQNLNYSYPYPAAKDLPSKVTATELKYLGKTETEDNEAVALIKPEAGNHFFRKPDFTAEEKPATAAEKGIFTHLALQYINLSSADSPTGVREEIARLKRERYLSDREAEAVNQKAIVTLFRSGLGERIRKADRMYREFRFSLLCSGKELLDADTDEEILLQGVVDCCLEEAGELVIIDYKTDAVYTPEQIQQRCELYSSQVKAYAMALSRIFEKPVKETILYFLSCAKAVTVK